jgi:PEGA domain
MAEIKRCFFRCTLLVFCAALLLTVPVYAFTADSLTISIAKNGDATAVFGFTLEGLLENAIPQSVLEDQLKNGLAGSTGSTELISMDRSSATLLMKQFASAHDVAQGTEYQTGSMDFKKAEIALKNSAVSSVITADFSPATVTVTFPDGYARSFSNVDSLPSLTHTVIDPAKAAAAAAAVTTGAINVSASPTGAEVYIDGTYAGNAPSTFSDLTAGTHTLRFQKDGYEPVTKNINVTAGRTVHISVFLAYVPPTTVPAPRSLPGFGGLAAGIALAGCALLRSSRTG